MLHYVNLAGNFYCRRQSLSNGNLIFLLNYRFKYNNGIPCNYNLHVLFPGVNTNLI